MNLQTCQFDLINWKTNLQTDQFGLASMSSHEQRFKTHNQQTMDIIPTVVLLDLPNHEF
jgi:hypothetical protein